MMGPVNYAALQAQLDLSPLQRGLQMRSNNRLASAEVQRQESAQQLAREKFEYDHAQDENYLRDVQAWKDSGGTAEGLRDLAMRHPEQSDRLLKAGDSYNAAQKRDMISTGFTTMGAIASGNIDLAKRNLSDRVTALDRGGIDSTETRQALDMLRNGNIDGARTYLSYAMSGLVGADHTASVMGSLGIGRKAENDERRLNLADRQAGVAERRLNETERHNRRQEGLSAAAGARAERKASGGSKTGSSKLPSGFIPD